MQHSTGCQYYSDLSVKWLQKFDSMPSSSFIGPQIDTTEPSGPGGKTRGLICYCSGFYLQFYSLECDLGLMKPGVKQALPPRHAFYPFAYCQGLYSRVSLQIANQKHMLSGNGFTQDYCL